MLFNWLYISLALTTKHLKLTLGAERSFVGGVIWMQGTLLRWREWLLYQGEGLSSAVGPVIKRSYLEVLGENLLISVLQLFPFLVNIAARKIQNVIRPLCLPSPPSVLPVNPPEAISSKHQEETDPDTENTAVLAMFPSPLKLQPPSSERHEDMSIQPSSTLGEPFVNPITTAAESSSSSSSFSILHAASWRFD